MGEMNTFIKKVLLNTVTTIWVLIAFTTIVVFWFPGSISFGVKVYGINIPTITTKNIAILLVIILGIMGATYKNSINKMQHFLIILSLAIILGHVITLIF